MRPTRSTSATRVPTSSPRGCCHQRSRSPSTTSASGSTRDRHVGSADRHDHGFFGRARLSERARFGHRRGFGAGDAHARPDGAARRARSDGGHDGRRCRRGLAAAPGEQRRPRLAAAARHLGHARAHQGVDLRRPLPLSLSPLPRARRGRHRRPPVGDRRVRDHQRRRRRGVRRRARDQRRAGAATALAARRRTRRAVAVDDRGVGPGLLQPQHPDVRARAHGARDRVAGHRGDATDAPTRRARRRHGPRGVRLAVGPLRPLLRSACPRRSWPSPTSSSPGDGGLP